MKGFKTKVLAVLALTLTISACSDEFGPQPDQLLSPESASLAKGQGKGGSGNGSENAPGNGKRTGPQVAGKKNGEVQYFRLAVKHQEPSRNKAGGWVDASGGTLAFDGHTLTIPAGAVSDSTYFWMKEAQQNVDLDLTVLAFDLYAIAVEGDTYVNVGERGFNVPVTLCVNYQKAVGYELENVESGTILWLQSAYTASEAAPSWTDVASKHTCGELEHFSRWALAWPM